MLLPCKRGLVLTLGMILALGACQQKDDDWDDQWGIEGELGLDETAVGKEDNAGIAGTPVSHDNQNTAVWVVRNQWEDTDTAEARLAGIAWGADSGLSWDQKYAAWIQAMERTAGHDTYYETFLLKTPWGKDLPAPALECAEVAMFLRITFASWYGLPFYLTSTDSTGTRIYFGHFGARTKSGRYKDTPTYKSYYTDYTSQFAGKDNQYIIDHWPSDSKLRERGLYGDGDDMPWLPGAGAKKAGHYFDQVFLNKRVGHFMRLILSYFGSMHVASSRNTYNLKPQALRAGDVLVERWQKQGIGHVLVVKQVTALPDNKLEANLVSGSMPRRQPKWEDGTASKHTFTIDYCGGVGTNSDGDEYAKLGGGLKRWRVAKNKNGYWTNTWMNADEASWINDTDYERISARPAEFEDLLGQVTPDQLRTSFLQMVSDARNHLRQYPASCSARERREDAFDLLYDLCQREFGMTKAQVDAQYRIFEDYVFAELEYTQSKTCCWNSSNAAMFQIIMDYNTERQQSGCTDAVVFKSMGGYNLFSDYAASTGRGHLWRSWSEDESCPQRDVSNDTEVTHAWTPYCDLGAAPPTPDCADDFEPNNSPSAAAAVFEGSYPGLEVCSGNEDYFALTVPSGGSLTARIEFTHSAGDLDMELYQGTNKIASSTSSSNAEEVSASAAGTYTLRVYGYNGAANAYTLTVTGGSGGPSGCTDGFEPNGDSSVATEISEGTYQSLQICANDADWYAVNASAGQTIVVRAEFSHATGDLDMTLYDGSVSQVAAAQSTSDNEEISVEAGASGNYYLKVFGYSGATAPYSLVLDLQ